MNIELNNLLDEIFEVVDDKDEIPDDYYLKIEDRQSVILKLKNEKEDLPYFILSYCKIISDNEILNLNLAQPIKKYVPISFYFSFIFQIDDEVINIDDNIIYFMTNDIQKIINAKFNVESDRLNLTTGFASTSVSNDSKLYYFDVQLFFPNARIEISKLKSVIGVELVKVLKSSNYFKFFSHQPVNEWNDILIIFDQYVPLYGFRLGHNRPPPTLKYIIPYDIYPTSYDFDQPLNIKKYINVKHFDPGFISSLGANFFEEYNIETIFPILYFNEYHVRSPLKLNGVTKYGGTKKNSQPIATNYDDENRENIEILEKLLPMLNRDRARIEINWFTIGKVIYRTFDGESKGLEIWITWSIRYMGDDIPDFIKDRNIKNSCEELYPTFDRNNNFTVKTIGWFASEDSPEKYNEWHHNWYMIAAVEALDSVHAKVSLALYRVYWLNFVYSNSKNSVWYEFKNNRWIKNAEGMGLLRSISHKFLRIYTDMIKDLNQLKNQSDDGDEIKKIKTRISIIEKLAGKLGNTPYKNSILRESKENFFVENFEEILDSNPALLGTKNGVIEIHSNMIFFRKSKPEDYISMTNSIPFNINYNWEHPLVIELMDWIQKIFIQEILVNHFLKFSSSCLHSGNIDKIFPIFTGEGDNSKSMIVKLFESTFGNYCVKFDVSNFTSRNNDPSKASPQLARSKATRIVFVDEPEDDVPMNKGIIKRWIGGDSFYTRVLHDNGSDIKVTFKMVMSCNKIPTIPNADQAIKNRIRIFPFLSKWVKDAPLDPNEQYERRLFQRDSMFEKRIPILAPAFLWILSQYYPIYVAEGLNDPEIITTYTENYWRERDVYAQFIHDSIEVIETDQNHNVEELPSLNISSIYTIFKMWFREAFPSVKIPERSIVKQELTTRFGNQRNGLWYGIRLVQTQYEITAR